MNNTKSNPMSTSRGAAQYATFYDYVMSRRVFIYLEPSLDSKLELLRFAKDHGINNQLDYSGLYTPTSPDDWYHMTLWYSKHGYSEPGVKYIEPVEVAVKGWEVLGQKHDYLTLAFEQHADITAIRDNFNSDGLVSDWPNFRPHLTMVNHWAKGKTTPRFDPPKTVTFDKVVVTDSF